MDSGSPTAAAWRRYVERRPDNPHVPWEHWRRQAGEALAHLCSEDVAALPVRMVCEVQLVLETYMQARLKMHMLYKVVRASDCEALWKDFNQSNAADDERSFAEAQEEERKEAAEFVAATEDVNEAVDEDGCGRACS